MQQPHRAHPGSRHRIAEEPHRQQGGGRTAHQQQLVGQIPVHECPFPVPCQRADDDQRDGQLHHGFQIEAGAGVVVDLLLDKAVAGEVGPHDEGEPGELAVAEEHVGEPRQRQGDRQMLLRGEPLFEEDDGEYDIEQRGHKEGEAGGQHLPGSEAPGEHAPADGHHGARQQNEAELARLAAQLCPGHLVAKQQKQGTQQHHRPEHPVGDQLPHVDLGHELIIERQHPPQDEGEGRGAGT